MTLELQSTGCWKWESQRRPGPSLWDISCKCVNLKNCHQWPGRWPYILDWPASVWGRQGKVACSQVPNPTAGPLSPASQIQGWENQRTFLPINKRSLKKEKNFPGHLKSTKGKTILITKYFPSSLLTTKSWNMHKWKQNLTTSVDYRCSVKWLQVPGLRSETPALALRGWLRSSKVHIRG